MNEQVSDYIAKIKVDWQAEICTTLRQLVHNNVPDVTERIQYGKPHFLKNGKYAFVLGTAKEWVSFTLFNAGSLEAPDGFFEAGDPERKTIKIRKGQTVDYDLLAGFIQQAAGK
ncbi:MAG: DUF1801 domain-containing protein [Anaerolineae bacterium]|nr:MAG: DUF1801 domain-containing protein [Anaerolineae bacterium]